MSSLLLSKYALILLYYCITLHRCSESCARSRSRSSPCLRSLWTRKEVVSAFKACGESRATCCRPSQKTSNWPHRLQSGCSNTGAEIKKKLDKKGNKFSRVCVLILLYYSSNWPHRLKRVCSNTGAEIKIKKTGEKYSYLDSSARIPLYYSILFYTDTGASKRASRRGGRARMRGMLYIYACMYIFMYIFNSYSYVYI